MTLQKSDSLNLRVFIKIPFQSTATDERRSKTQRLVCVDDPLLVDKQQAAITANMSEENAFFAAPPAEGGDENPIVLAPPADDAFAGGGGGDYGGFAQAPEGGAEPTYLGDVNEAPSMEDAPIVLGGGSGDEDEVPMVPESSEPTPMQVWNTEWQETLKGRKDEENARKAALLEESRVALEEFLKSRETKRETSMASNRQDEQAKLEAIEADLENDNSWQRVCKMVELQHDSTEAAQDIKRMRDVMILLKNEPTKATTLSA